MIYRAVFLIFVFGLSALAEIPLPQKRITVQVTVSAPDSMKREAVSAIDSSPLKPAVRFTDKMSESLTLRLSLQEAAKSVSPLPIAV